MKLEDLLKPKIHPNIIEKLNEYHETATPEQAIQELDELGVEFDEEHEYKIQTSLEDYDPPIRSGDAGSIINELPGYLLNDPEIVGYPNLEFQELIYNWVGSKIPVHQDVSIKDLGCGRGDFYGWLQDQGSNARYLGIDLNPNLCEVAKVKYPKINIIADDFLNCEIQSDYTISIGTLNEDNGNDKWDNFNKTLNYAINTTKRSILFVLSRNSDNLEGFNDFPFNELFNNLPQDVLFEIDYSKLEEIYLLTVHIGGYNN